MSVHQFQKQQEDDQEQEDDDEEELECFQDSLDRILSSASASASSATVSEDDYDNQNSPNYNSDNPRIPIPKFPISGTKFDVWINGPLSVQERRKRLLKEMGLSKDPLLSRKDMDIGRSASYDHLHRKGELSSINSSDCFITRSKSDSSATTSDYCNNSNNSTLSTSVCKDVSIVDKTHVCSNSRRNERNNSGSPGSPVVSNNKPPSGRNSKRNIPTKLNTDSASESPGLFTFDVSGGEHAINSVCNGVLKNSHILPSIKNLENEEEFIVKEIDTGHQFTREEFESCAGHSPIVQELMRRQNVERLDLKKNEFEQNEKGDNVGGDNGFKSKKKGSWFKSIKNVANAVTGHWEKRNNDEWDASSGRRSSSGTDDSQNMSHHYPEKVRVRQYGKSCKDLTALYKNQEIQAHNGSIWSIKFSSDGQYLASAGEDCVIHVWQVTESKMRGDVFSNGHTNPFFVTNGSPEVTLVPSMGNNNLEKKKRSKVSGSRKSANLDHIVVPDSIFMLSETPICSFRGHLDDVLDLSWSNSQYLLSSSMDKTVKLWHRDSNSCLKTFSHSDYVTCIQFNPIDDRYFISGSLDAKVRIWSIPERQVVDWYDLHEMVTAASYTPDGQGALVGSYNGSCRLFNTSDNKLQQKSQIDLQNKRKKSHLKKITGFQFAPGNSSEVLITSADSRIRVVDGSDLVHKFKGFRNTNSQMSASLTRNGKYVVSASEDSYVYVWKHEGNSRPSRNKGVTITNSHEHFLCRDVSVAIPWPVLYAKMGIQYNSAENNCLTRERSAVNGLSGPTGSNQCQRSPSPSPRRGTNSTLSDTVSNVNNNYFFDRFSVTWPEEKLPLAGQNQIPRNSFDLPHRMSQDSSALGMVIVTASLKGQIRIFQNFGLPIRV